MNGFNDDLSSIEGTLSDIQSQHLKSDLDTKENFKRYRDKLFTDEIKIIKVMFLVSFPLLAIAPYTIKEPAYIVLPIIAVMIPTVFTLAMMRFVYSNDKEVKKDHDIPSITFNIGKELTEVLKDIIKK